MPYVVYACILIMLTNSPTGSRHNTVFLLISPSIIILIVSTIYLCGHLISRMLYILLQRVKQEAEMGQKIFQTLHILQSGCMSLFMRHSPPCVRFLFFLVNSINGSIFFLKYQHFHPWLLNHWILLCSITSDSFATEWVEASRVSLRLLSKMDSYCTSKCTCKAPFEISLSFV